MRAVFLQGFCDCFFAEQFREEEGAGGGFDREDFFGAETAALESDLVDTRKPRTIAGNHRVRRHILRDLGAGTAPADKEVELRTCGRGRIEEPGWT